MREIAQRTDGELIVATAVQQVGVWDATLTLQVMEKEEEMAQQYLGDKVGELTAGCKAQPRVTRGDAAEAILSLADEEEVDLIAISTHGRSGIARFLFGSVATKILQAANQPVLFLRPKEGVDKGAPGPVVQRILVPLDGSELSLSVLPQIEGFATAMGASLILFHAVSPITAYPGFEMSPVAVGSVIEESQEYAKIRLHRRGSGGARRRGDDRRGPRYRHGRRLARGRRTEHRPHRHRHPRPRRLQAYGLGSTADAIVRRSGDLPCLVLRAKEEEAEKG